MSIDTIRAALARHDNDWQGYPAITAAEARAAVAEADDLRDRLMREREAALRVSNQEVLDRVNEIAKPLIDGLVAERDAIRSRVANMRRILARAQRERVSALDRAWDCSIARMGLLAQLHWHEEQHGTRKEQEREAAEYDAAMDEISAMTPEEQDAMLRADGEDPEALAERTRWWMDKCLERALRWQKMTAERNRLRSALAGLCSATGAESFDEIDRLWAAARAALEEQS